MLYQYVAQLLAKKNGNIRSDCLHPWNIHVVLKYIIDLNYHGTSDD